MKKVKVYHNNNQVLIKTKIENTEYINERDYQIFQTRLIRGLLRPAKEGTKCLGHHLPISPDSQHSDSRHLHFLPAFVNTDFVTSKQQDSIG